MDLVFHLLLPIMLLLLAGIRLSRKEYFALAFFSILPDFDRLVFLSRQGFHSLFFIAIVLLALFLLSRKKRFGNKLFFLAAFGIFSHLLFDFSGPISYLYPFDTSFYQITLNIKIIHFLPAIFFSIGKVLPVEQGLGILVSEPGFGILVLFAILLACKKIAERKAGKNNSHFLQ